MKIKNCLTVEWLLRIVCLAMIFYQMFYCVTLCNGPWENMNLHLLFSFLVVFLGTIKKKGKRMWIVAIPCLLIAIGCCAYIFANMSKLIMRQGVLTRVDILVGILLVAVTLEAAREVGGLLFPAIALLGILYTAFGQYMPDPFWHFPISLNSAIGKFCMAQAGIFGDILGLSANYLFLMMVFGSFLVASGADIFFWEIGKLAGAKLAGGPGIIAVISSMLFGTVSGSGPANVAVTGTFTIPMMKNVGYRPEQAGAIEAVASSGGAFVPPIMGSTAFVMAAFVGVPYGRVCMLAIIPCILYYLSCGVYVQFNAQRMNISALIDQRFDGKLALQTGYMFGIPLAIIVVLLFWGYSLRIIVFVVILVTLALCMTRKESRYGLVKWLDICVDGAESGVMVAISGATLGVLLGALDLTGLAIKFPAIVSRFSNGNLFIGLLLTGIVTIVLGMGVPPFAAYITSAMLCAPALVDMGAPLLAAHFFILFLAAIGAITPPVAISCFVAAPLAKAPYVKTCIEACKCAFISWMIPFFAIYTPGILFLPDNKLTTVLKVTAVLMSLFIGQSAMAGHFFWAPLAMPMRLLHYAVTALCVLGKFASLYCQCCLYMCLLHCELSIWKTFNRLNYIAKMIYNSVNINAISTRKAKSVYNDSYTQVLFTLERVPTFEPCRSGVGHSTKLYTL
jgi:TRAP transporter 4TM/12TM fusion protein